MTFEMEMDQFFARNCYSEEERLRVKAWPPYRLAAENNDVVQAQETAARVLEGADRSGHSSPLTPPPPDALPPHMLPQRGLSVTQGMQKVE